MAVTIQGSASSLGEEVRNVGRTIKNGSENLVRGVSRGAQRVFSDIAAITKSSGGIASGIKLTVYTLKSIDHFRGVAGVWTKFLQAFANAEVYNDIVTTFFPGLSYAVNSGHKKDSLAHAIGDWAIFGAGIALVGELLNKAKLVDFGFLSSAIGNVPLIGSSLASLTVGTFVTGIVTFAFGCYFIDAAQRLMGGGNRKNRTKAFLDLLWSASEIALGAAVMTGAISAGGVLVLGTAAGALGCLSFLYGNSLQHTH